MKEAFIDIRKQLEKKLKKDRFEHTIGVMYTACLLYTSSVENLKPDLVMEAFCQFLGIEPDSVKFQHHRLEMYTDRSEDGSLIPLEAMGVDMTGDEE